jgi:hypothetical protein
MASFWYLICLICAWFLVPPPRCNWSSNPVTQLCYPSPRYHLWLHFTPISPRLFSHLLLPSTGSSSKWLNRSEQIRQMRVSFYQRPAPPYLRNPLCGIGLLFFTSTSKSCIAFEYNRISIGKIFIIFRLGFILETFVNKSWGYVSSNSFEEWYPVAVQLSQGHKTKVDKIFRPHTQTSAAKDKVEMKVKNKSKLCTILIVACKSTSGTCSLLFKLKCYGVQKVNVGFQ